MTNSIKAFEAPILADCNSNSSGAHIARTVGDVCTQYGATENGNTRENLARGILVKKIAFADPKLVDLPRRNTRFDV